MGMKYIEPVKSIVLFLLVMLSIVLTFLIWTYRPDYEYIEKTEVKEVVIGTKKSIDEVVKPYKIVFRTGDAWTGTSANEAIKGIMNAFEEWTAFDLEQVNSNISSNYLNEIMRTKNQLTLFFAGEIPYSTFNSILKFSDNELPETTFNRMIIDWNDYANKELDIFFTSSNNKSLWRSHVKISDAEDFLKEIIEPSKKYSAFKEIERTGNTSLYIVDEKVTLQKYMYIINNLSSELFKDVLFTDPNTVSRNEESTTSEKYSDGISEMIVENELKSLYYVYPAAESSRSIVPSKIVKDSFDFVNEHGGFTGDYRYIAMNTNENQMNYQLYSQGLPVYSNQITTRITTNWGDNHIFRYKRPVFSLDMNITPESDMQELLPGTKIIEGIKNLQGISISDIDDIVIGYYLTQDENELFFLEPSWFVIQKGNWSLLTPEMLGGVENRLE